MGDRAVPTRFLTARFYVFGPHKFTDLACMLRMRLYPMDIINLPVLRWIGYSHLYGQGSHVEIRKLSERALGEIDMLGSFGASGACVNNSDKDTFVLGGFAY